MVLVSRQHVEQSPPFIPVHILFLQVFPAEHSAIKYRNFLIAKIQSAWAMEDCMSFTLQAADQLTTRLHRIEQKPLFSSAPRLPVKLCRERSCEKRPLLDFLKSTLALAASPGRRRVSEPCSDRLCGVFRLCWLDSECERGQQGLVS